MADLSVLKNIVRTGRVSSVNAGNRTARVTFEDKGQSPLVSGELKVIKNPPFIPAKGAAQRTESESGGSGEAAFAAHSHAVKIAPWLPSPGDYVLCLYILFNLVTQAEKQFGSGTGSLKYAAVADWIYQRIPAVLKLLFTSSDIEKMIEAALEEAKKAWGANENLKGYIDTPSVESLLVGIEEQAVQTEPAEN